MIRAATRDDLNGIGALRLAWAAERFGGTGPVDEDLLRIWWDAEQDRRTVFLAFEGTDAIGMVSAVEVERMPWPDRRGGRWTYLAQLFVHPEHRGHRIGGALVREVVRRSRAAGCERVLLNPSERSRPVYEREGFGPAGRLLVLEL